MTADGPSSSGDEVLGIDIGGSSVKAALVDVGRGAPSGAVVAVDTPRPATPPALAGVVGELASRFGCEGRIGVTFPGVVRAGTVYTAANVDPAWIGDDAAGRFSEATGCEAIVLNDADAAGVAEAAVGAARNEAGVVLVLTLGTGIGSALLHGGGLVPNSEFGHLVIDGHDAETTTSARVKVDEELSWAEWSGRLDRYLHYVDALVNPDLIVIGGGISADHERFLPLLTLRTPVTAARLGNDAGIVGAALAARSGIPVRGRNAP